MARCFVLYVIRHLPTSGNEQKKYIGWTNEPMIPTQRMLGSFPFKPSSVYCSDLIRAKETAALYFPEREYLPNAAFRECHFGDFEGKTYADLENDQDYRNWIEDPLTYTPRGGESLEAVRIRVLQALKLLPGGAALVTHGGPIRIILSTFSKDQKNFWSWHVPHGSVWKLTWQNEQAFEEGEQCTSISAVPITENGNTSKIG
ncbi:histidine phosphatase family protein [Sporosarcina sp. HYO08]|uniref:histidine phosphatase family protein n=1 Tax=Sporosarcina sp. HYO08 TaxID=1759557 RepID=UPI000792803B|nr:histidine phosphatase family protein [Sporosarcina sp. HYO08]KXH83947.1 hypothetical protein AU377_04120 [Sporosarcina sp. HYO08]